MPVVYRRQARSFTSTDPQTGFDKMFCRATRMFSYASQKSDLLAHLTKHVPPTEIFGMDTSVLEDETDPLMRCSGPYVALPLNW